MANAQAGARVTLILASKSETRRQMLEAAGLTFEVVTTDLDEESVASDGLRRGDTPEMICAELARRKALAVAVNRPDAFVIGADQMLYDERAIRFKSLDSEIAIATLMALRGREHFLVSSASVARGNEILWEGRGVAKMLMRSFDEAFARRYIARIGDVATHCLGGYEIEGLGAWLFDAIEGDSFIIRGMPLIPLLGFLSTKGFGP